MTIPFSSQVAEYLAKAMSDLVDGDGRGDADPTGDFPLPRSTLEIGGGDPYPVLTLRSADGQEVARYSAPGWYWERLYSCDHCGREQWLDRSPDGDECNCRPRPSTEDEDNDR